MEAEQDMDGRIREALQEVADFYLRLSNYDLEKTIPLKQNLKNYFYFNLAFYIISDLQKDMKYDITNIHVPITQLKQY